MLGARPALLDRAILRYVQLHQPVDRSKTPSTWYAEARFYKGLAFLQQGRWEDASHAVEQIDPRLDPSVDVDYLVWSYSKRQLNRRVPTQTLQDEYLRILKASGALRKPKGVPDASTFDAIVRELEGSLGRKALSRAN